MIVKMWEIILDKELFPLSLQPVMWMEGGSIDVMSKKSNPNEEVTLQVRSRKEKCCSQGVVYDVHEILVIQLEVANVGGEEVSSVI
ncbi:hypothetical protein FO521_32165, partial [Bacillus pseudomycoides]|nr:hypothetical protein [Bacillus pseudomycoides]